MDSAASSSDVPATAEATSPDVSVVVATANRAPLLERLLESLTAQDLARDRFEVVIVDDSSTDATRAVLEAATASGSIDLRALHLQGRSGPGGARNAGWRTARAPLVAFIDDDCRADPGWLVALLRAARDGTPVIQGRTDPEPEEAHLLGPFARTIRVDRAGPFFQACNIAYPRELLERLGGFDTDALPGWGGEDADLAWRAIEAGAEIRFAEAARVRHAVRRIGPLGKLRLAAGWSQLALVVKRHPQLRTEQLHKRVFWKGSHYLLVRALLAIILPRRWRGLRLWLASPYLRALVGRGREEGAGPAFSAVLAPFYLAVDLAELSAMVRGSVRYRTLIL